MAGHSLGEYAALVAAGALAFADALPLVRFRAQAMQDAVPAGRRRDGCDHGQGMQDEQAGVVDACAEAAQGQVVEAVNFNAPGQIVIAGHREAVERAIVAAQGARRQTRRAAFRSVRRSTARCSSPRPIVCATILAR